MLKFIDSKSFGSYFILTVVLCAFVLGFFMLENTYLKRSTVPHTVVLGKELFNEAVPGQLTGNKQLNIGDYKNADQIEYKRTSFVFQDSGEAIVTETWIDPVTLENRTNYIVTSASGKIEKNFTYYTNDGAKHHINIFRDENGKAVDGQEFYYSQEKADTDAGDLRKYDTFAGCKAMYEDAAFWTDKGTVTSDGKILKKILCGNEQEGNTTCVYIDEATGFPVKEESYGNGKLISTMTYEFKYADRDEKLFDAIGEGVKLKQLDVNKVSKKLKEAHKKIQTVYKPDTSAVNFEITGVYNKNIR